MLGRQLFQSAIKHKFPFVANMSVNRMLRQLTGAGPATIAECSILENRKQLATG